GSSVDAEYIGGSGGSVRAEDGSVANGLFSGVLATLVQVGGTTGEFGAANISGTAGEAVEVPFGGMASGTISTTLTGFPEGTTFSDGTPNSTGTEVSFDGLPPVGFAFTAPADAEGDFDIRVFASDEMLGNTSVQITIPVTLDAGMVMGAAPVAADLDFGIVADIKAIFTVSDVALIDGFASDADSDLEAEDISLISVTIDGQDVSLADAGFTLAPGTGDAGSFTIDSTGPAFAGLVIGETAEVIVTFSVTDGEQSDTGTLRYVIESRTNDLEGVYDLPDDGILRGTLTLAGDLAEGETATAEAMAGANEIAEAVTITGGLGFVEALTPDADGDTGLDRLLESFLIDGGGDPLPDDAMGLDLFNVDLDAIDLTAFDGFGIASAAAVDGASATSDVTGDAGAFSIALFGAESESAATDQSFALARAADAGSTATATADNDSASDARAESGSTARATATLGSQSTSDARLTSSARSEARIDSFANATADNDSTTIANADTGSTASAFGDNGSLSEADAEDGGFASSDADAGADAFAVAFLSGTATATAELGGDADAAAADVNSVAEAFSSGDGSFQSSEAIAVADNGSDAMSEAAAGGFANANADSAGAISTATAGVNGSASSEAVDVSGTAGAETTIPAFTLADDMAGPAQSVTYDGFPVGTTFSAGSPSADGTSVTFTGPPPMDFTFTAPASFAGDFTLTITATDGDDEAAAIQTVSIEPGSGGTGPTSGTLFFVAEDPDAGFELFSLDSDGNLELFDIASGTADSSPQNFLAFKGEFYFRANSDGVSSIDLFKVDQDQQLQPVADFPDREIGTPFVRDDELFFAVGGRGFGATADLYKLDQTGQPVFVSQMPVNFAGIGPDELVELDNDLYFTANPGGGSDLFRIDPDGTVTIAADINSTSARPLELVEFGGSLYLGGSFPNVGSELARYDANGTLTTIDFYPGISGLDPKEFTVFNNALYFRGRTEDGSLDLFRVNPDQSIEQLNRDGEAGPLTPEFFLEFDNKLFFTGVGDANVGVELFFVDENGVVQLGADIVPGSGGSFPIDYAIFDGALYFRAFDADGEVKVHRYETDGTVVRVSDIVAGESFAVPFDFIEFNGALYFNGLVDGFGQELVRLEPDGTVSVVDVVPGEDGSSPFRYFVLDETGPANGSTANAPEVAVLTDSFDFSGGGEAEEATASSSELTPTESVDAPDSAIIEASAYFSLENIDSFDFRTLPGGEMQVGALDLYEDLTLPPAEAAQPAALPAVEGEGFDFTWMEDMGVAHQEADLFAF
ncbi:MAG: hypothetical protein AAFY10_06055, partial [Pseudomonadota bacterium]